MIMSKNDSEELLKKIAVLQEKLEISREETKRWIQKAADAIDTGNKNEMKQRDRALQFENMYKCSVFKRAGHALRMLMGRK